MHKCHHVYFDILEIAVKPYSHPVVHTVLSAVKQISTLQEMGSSWGLVMLVNRCIDWDMIVAGRGEGVLLESIVY